MPDWLHTTFQSDADLALSTLTARLVAALVAGCVVALIYRRTHGQSADATPGLNATLVMLCILIAMVTMVIGSNVARAFSLVGALAIVRFRTVVEDTRDTAFVIFAVAVGMAVGAGAMKVPLVGIPVAALAAFLFRPVGGEDAAATYLLTVRFGLGQIDEAALSAAIARYAVAPFPRLRSAGTARQGSSLERVYSVRIGRDVDASALVDAINTLPGAQSVEIKRA